MKRKAHFQRTFAAQTSFEMYGRKSKREQFLDQMNEVVPWSRLLSLVEPYYPKAGNGRRPVGLEIMLRAYFVQRWFNLSDPGMEDALYDSASLWHFVGVDLGTASAPDETTILRSRHLLEEHDLGGAMLSALRSTRHRGSRGTRRRQSRSTVIRKKHEARSTSLCRSSGSKNSISTFCLDRKSHVAV